MIVKHSVVMWLDPFEQFLAVELNDLYIFF